MKFGIVKFPGSNSAAGGVHRINAADGRFIAGDGTIIPKFKATSQQMNDIHIPGAGNPP